MVTGNGENFPLLDALLHQGVKKTIMADQNKSIQVKCLMTDAASQTFDDNKNDSCGIKSRVGNCIITCKHNGQDPKPNRTGKTTPWIRCCLCIHWFHPDCVDLPQTEVNGVWSCPACRHMASDVRILTGSIKTLRTTVSTLEESVQTLLEIVRRNNLSITQLVSDQQETFEAVKILQPTAPVEAPSSTSPPVLHKSLLIGDSLIKNVVSTSDRLSVISHLPKVKDVVKRFENIEELENIYIVVGTNDCKSKADSKEIVDDFRILIQEAKGKATNVHLSSIPPRTDAQQVLEKIKQVNEFLRTLADEEDIHFVNNDNNFLYRNDDVDKTLLQLDQCHLSHEGNLRLIGNLGLKELAKSSLVTPGKPPEPSSTSEAWTRTVGRKNKRSAVPSVPQSSDAENVMPHVLPLSAPPAPTPPPLQHKILFHGHQHPLSNFFPCTLDLYDKQWANSEAAYQYRKALEYSEWETAEQIAQCSRGIDAKRLGDRIKTDQRWWDIRESVMMEVVTQKARQCWEFRNTLFASEGNLLVEDTGHDFWGRGKQGKGLNKLGSLLQALRSHMPSPLPQKKENRLSREQYRPHNPFRNESKDTGCNFCGERGHSSVMCGHGRPIKCRNCNGFCHKEKDCYYK